MKTRNHLSLLIFLFLGACSPSAAEVEASITQIAADILATSEAQKASEPTAPPPTLQPTAALTPVPDAVITGPASFALREGPNYTFDTIAVIPSGSMLTVIGKRYESCSFLKVVDPEFGEGWIRNNEDYLQLNLDCEEIPFGTFRPHNGAIREDERTDFEGSPDCGEFAVSNGLTSDSLVLLLTPDEKAYITFYVRAMSDVTITGIANNTYAVYFTTGSEYNPGTGRFSQDAYYQRFEEPLEFLSSSSSCTVYSLTLNPVEGGEALTESVSADTFPD